MKSANQALGRDGNVRPRYIQCFIARGRWPEREKGKLWAYGGLNDRDIFGSHGEGSHARIGPLQRLSWLSRLS